MSQIVGGYRNPLVARGPDSNPRVLECTADGELLTTFASGSTPGMVPEYWPGANVFYVSPTGDNSDGLTPETALRSPQDIMSLVSPYDIVIIRGGTYNHSASKWGFVHNVNNVNFYARGGPAIFTNTLNTDAGGSAITATSSNSEMWGVQARKGEVASNGSSAIRMTGNRFRFMDSIALVGNNASHRGVVWDDGAIACSFNGTRPEFAAAFGITPGGRVGDGYYFGDCDKCFVSRVGGGILNRVAVYSGDATDCSHDKDSLFQGANYGTWLMPGASECISDARPQNIAVPIHDLSEEVSNYPRGSIVHVTQTLSGNAGTHTVNLARVEGILTVDLGLGFVTVSPSNATAIYLSVEDGASTPLTKIAGAPAITGFLPGSTIIKELGATEIIGVYNSNIPKIIEGSNRTPSVPFILQQENGGTTYLAMTYTTVDSPVSGQIEWHFKWTPESDQAGLYPLA